MLDWKDSIPREGTLQGRHNDFKTDHFWKKHLGFWFQLLEMNIKALNSLQGWWTVCPIFTSLMSGLLLSLHIRVWRHLWLPSYLSVGADVKCVRLVLDGVVAPLSAHTLVDRGLDQKWLKQDMKFRTGVCEIFISGKPLHIVKKSDIS